MEIRLASVQPDIKARVLYDFTSRQYVEVPPEDLIEDFLDLPSKVLLKEDLVKLEKEKAESKISLARQYYITHQQIKLQYF